MNTDALIMMISTQIVVASACGYFFYKVVTTKQQPHDKE
ncbi:hypothetical protein Halhy_6217 [Haliscomenobacter hydrossis DSM 1100]|uniref:Uncharacterized protein n=1 Tax=Haliscomenobacter hydrossis (strain ATCC 27775 / DSM 1100 / LMG 10767 / O) TaxID=760192 RepID=F4L4X5_HALH1|nr:hypothetical protein Halhy_6217 [Haliscomenobacter hydrossis DSM 1100]